ncbi:MAG: hypothetical protein JWR50_2466 [Mucilaginibacter sp.]|nr:hypothetical protein [Mucilaginibacter sp.]
MKRITLLLLLFTSLASAQKSALYNSKRQFIADTTFSVDEHTYKDLPSIESKVLPEIYNYIRFPRFETFDESSGIIIVKLTFAKGELNFDVVRSKNAALESAVYWACKAAKNDYHLAHRNDDYLLYVPIKFKHTPNKFEELLKKNNAIMVEGEESIAGGFRETVIEDWIYTTPNGKQQKRN